MASQVVPARKRYRISLLLDAYGKLLTDKQKTYMHQYFEKDLSFGEIARQYGVSRQAIFDAVRHGEDSLEYYEKALRLVGNGWNAWSTQRLAPQSVAERLAKLRSRIDSPQRSDSPARRRAMLKEIDNLIDALGLPTKIGRGRG